MPTPKPDLSDADAFAEILEFMEKIGSAYSLGSDRFEKIFKQMVTAQKSWKEIAAKKTNMELIQPVRIIIPRDAFLRLDKKKREVIHELRRRPVTVSWCDNSGNQVEYEENLAIYCSQEIFIEFTEKYPWLLRNDLGEEFLP